VRASTVRGATNPVAGYQTPAQCLVAEGEGGWGHIVNATRTDLMKVGVVRSVGRPTGASQLRQRAALVLVIGAPTPHGKHAFMALNYNAVQEGRLDSGRTQTGR
jgi:hypothetical protein